MYTDERQAGDATATRSPSRRSFIKIGLGVAVGATLASVAEVPYYSDQNYQKDTQIASLKSQLDAVTGQLQQLGQLKAQVSQLTAEAESLQSQVNAITGFLYLNTSEQSLLEAVVEAIIPSDSSGPGAKEAGAIYFIDRQLAGDYGTNGTMYMEGPFVQPGQQGPIVVGGISYPHGTAPVGLSSGTRYQYSMNLRYFWRWGLDAMQSYSNSAYGGNFESLDPAQQAQVLTDLWDNKPTSFNSIIPFDFAYELFFMAWSGFLTDPVYGGNRGMVGWEYVAFNGTNSGDFYGEGKAPLTLALDTTPTRLKPATLSQFQKLEPLL